MILFEENWKQEVRDYLRPYFFSSFSGIDQERSDLNFYRLEIVNRKETTLNINGRWGEFKLGNARINYLGTPQYGSEEKAGITWALKDEFSSPLHFWAAATLVANAFDTEEWGTSAADESWLNFSIPNFQIEQSSHVEKIEEMAKTYWPKGWYPSVGTSSYSPNLIELARHDWANSQPALPQVIYEKEIDSYRFSSKWSNLSILFETEKHFILWCWQTYA